MAIVQTGSSIRLTVSSTATPGTVSSSITVPADAEIVIVGHSGYSDLAAGRNYKSMTFTKGGTDTAMHRVEQLDYRTDCMQGSLWWLDAPDTGASKTLKWSWQAATLTIQNLFSVTFWKGIDTSYPVRDDIGRLKPGVGTALTLPTLNAKSGDLVVAWISSYSTGSITSYVNLTELEVVTPHGTSDGFWATTSPSGPVAVGVASTTTTDLAIGAIVLNAAGGGPRFDGNLARLTGAAAYKGTITTYSTPPFLPADSSLLVAVATALQPNGESTATTIASSPSLTWTLRKKENHADGGNGWVSSVYIWTAPVATAAKTTITITANPVLAHIDGGYAVEVFDITNYTPSTFVVQTFGDGGAVGRSGAYSGAFSGAPASTSYLISGTTMNADNSTHTAAIDGDLTPGSGWTLAREDYQNYSAYGVEYRTGTTSTAVAWANLNASSSASWSVAAIEIGITVSSGGAVAGRKTMMMGIGKMMGR